ncbi:MAG: M81 family metallopeptidase, partial [Deltaproteobacteria bacterium]|nr:M81 family metallopeptidase [Deltaproteobacteria bacterium]
MKLFSATLQTETNTFSPMPTGEKDFDVVRSSEVNEEDDDGQGAVPFWYKLSKDHGFDFTWGLIAGAQPSGRTVQAVYEALRDEILDALKAAMPVDIVLLDLHGAMVAMAQDDCEGDLISRVRDITGPETVIGVLLDPHCHLTHLMIEKSDLIVLYKEYPHVDGLDRSKELFELAVKTRQGKIQPTMAVFDCKMVKTF